MEPHWNSCAGHRLTENEADDHAERLTALAKGARLLEFALKGESDASRRVASEIEGALTDAMNADSADELTNARDALGVALEDIARLGMRFTAQLTDMEIGGIRAR